MARRRMGLVTGASLVKKPVVVPTLAVEVIADRSGKWCGNALQFETLEQATTYGGDLYSRWTLVSDWRVIDVETGEVLHQMGTIGGR